MERRSSTIVLSPRCPGQADEGPVRTTHRLVRTGRAAAGSGRQPTARGRTGSTRLPAFGPFVST